MSSSSKRFGMRYGRRRGMNPGTSLPDEKLPGWAGIEEHLMTHDIGEMEDYADDIDTLLVFAGLFSAILTAFLVGTYPMLQQSGGDTTNQLLALSVAMQFRAINSTISEGLSHTLSTLSSALSTPFTPTTAARWINALLFLSLVYGLAAALFSILAKQWIREYIKWNSPLAVPRENILVRQLRVEAWDAWQVRTVLASIPILLELAMILFLTGVIILLWTLDDTVARVVTLFISLFLGAFAAFTLMPIFSRRCPYRSPTAWACLYGAQFLFFPFLYCYHVMRNQWEATGVHRGFWRRCFTTATHAFRAGLYDDEMSWSVPPATWRNRDLDIPKCHAIVSDKRRIVEANDLLRAAQRELRFEATKNIPPRNIAAALITHISETSHLMRALAWVKQSSQTAQVNDFISQCTAGIHSTIPTFEDAHWVDSIRIVTDWCISWSIENDCPAKPHNALLPPPSAIVIQSLVRHDAGVSAPDADHLYVSFARHRASESKINQGSKIQALASIHTLTLHADCDYFSQRVQNADIGLAELCLARTRAMTTFGLLFRLPSPHEDTDTWPIFLAATGSQPSKLHAPVLSAISADILSLTLRHGRIQWDSKRKGITFEPLGNTVLSDYEEILWGLEISNINGSMTLQLYTFIEILIRWLEAFRNHDGPDVSPNIARILHKVIIAAEFISNCTSRDKRWNAISVDEEWIKQMRWFCEDMHHLVGLPSVLTRRLFHTFERAYHLDALIGDRPNLRRQLHYALTSAHRDGHCELPECPWTLHEQPQPLPPSDKCANVEQCHIFLPLPSETGRSELTWNNYMFHKRILPLAVQRIWGSLSQASRPNAAPAFSSDGNLDEKNTRRSDKSFVDNPALDTFIGLNVLTAPPFLPTPASEGSSRYGYLRSQQWDAAVSTGSLSPRELPGQLESQNYTEEEQSVGVMLSEVCRDSLQRDTMLADNADVPNANGGERYRMEHSQRSYYASLPRAASLFQQPTNDHEQAIGEFEMIWRGQGGDKGDA
ncbi:hypothetical protein PsYK624_076930 [Phanerochaete sordida]|uniref:DUF6535 domain-containing protein n=1 Tax=Phanerochaete sordida TaxID=48140 RepID=A0A9P3LEI3_9APHY|nr:hypothetical protein PsYK624_076930 [Phanerochaete sordida]